MTCGNKTRTVYIVNYITDTRVTTPDRIYGGTGNSVQYTLDMDEEDDYSDGNSREH